MIDYYEKCMRRTNKYEFRKMIRRVMWLGQIAKYK
jgi:hypothetical protein